MTLEQLKATVQDFADFMDKGREMLRAVGRHLRGQTLKGRRTSGGYRVAVFVDGLKYLNIYVLVVHFLLSAKPGTRQPLEDRCTFGARSRRWRPAAQSTSLPQFMGRVRSCAVAFSCSRVKQVLTNPQSVVETLLSARYIF